MCTTKWRTGWFNHKGHEDFSAPKSTANLIITAKILKRVADFQTVSVFDKS
jgi:hypothetical protein